MEFEIDSPETKPAKEASAQAPSQDPSSKIKKEERGLISLANWRRLRICLRVFLYLGLVLYCSGRFFMGKFDEKMEISRTVRLNPVQADISEDPFFFAYGKEEYWIQPTASYDISGLIVTHNDVSSIADAYHTSESVDFRDVCLVWGSNVSSGVYRRFKFWSEPWSCHMKTEDSAAAASFNAAGFSNNHLLSPDPRVRETIRSLRIGDQVRLQGMLINYSPKWSPESLRKTSLERDDTGNGACEVLWVESAEILKRGGTGWHLARDLGFWLLVTALVGGVGMFVLAPVRLYL